MKNLKTLFIIAFVVIATTIACNNSTTNSSTISQDSTEMASKHKDTTLKSEIAKDSFANQSVEKKQTKTNLPIVLIYNFHVTNRCASCIAIEESTTLTLNRYFAKELKEGRIIRRIVNVDDKKNNIISEKYEAFGSGLFVTQVYKGKETTTDLTGDGFKYARNKQEKFIEILKAVISNYLN